MRTRLLLIRSKLPDSLRSSHSVPTHHENRSKLLDACTHHALSAGKPALAQSPHKQYRNTWQNLVTAIARNAGREMIEAFFQSLKYGSTGVLRLLLQGTWRLLSK